MISNKKSLLALSVASALVLSGCFSDDDDNVVVTPPTPPEPTDPVVVAPETPDELSFVVTGNVVNADYDVIASEVTLLENGELSDNTVDVNGNPINAISAPEGDFSFTFSDGATPDEITVNVAAEGYIGKSFILDLTTVEGETSITPVFELVSKTAEGVADEVVEATVADATTSAPITAAAETGSAGTNVTVPASTQLLDANNNPVTGTNVSLNVTTADSSSSTAGAIIPEGLTAANATELKDPVTVANIVMTDDQGNKIKRFSQPIEITMAIPSSTTLSSGETIQTGDELSLSSHNEDTGVWSDEDTKLTIGALNSTNNTYSGSFMTDHLTVYVPYVPSQICAADLQVNLSGDEVPQNGLTMTLSAGTKSHTYNIRSNGSVSGKGKIGITTEYNVTVRDKTGQVWYQSEFANPVCGAPIDITLDNPVTLVSEGFSVNAVCSNDNTVTTPLTGANVRYGLEGKGLTKASGSGGTYQLTDLVENSTYRVKVTPRGAAFAGVEEQTFSITADGTAESGDISIQCNEATGS